MFQMYRLWFARVFTATHHIEWSVEFSTCIFMLAPTGYGAFQIADFQIMDAQPVVHFLFLCELFKFLIVSLQMHNSLRTGSIQFYGVCCA